MAGRSDAAGRGDAGQSRVQAEDKAMSTLQQTARIFGVNSPQFWAAAQLQAAQRMTDGERVPEAVVIDDRDGYTFWRGAENDGALFTVDAAQRFAATRNAELEHDHYRVYALSEITSAP